MNDWHNLHITDCTGKHFFITVASPMSTASEIKNLKRHIARAKVDRQQYCFLDAASAVIMIDGSPYGALQLDADALLKELGL